MKSAILAEKIGSPNIICNIKIRQQVLTLLCILANVTLFAYYIFVICSRAKRSSNKKKNAICKKGKKGRIFSVLWDRGQSRQASLMSHQIQNRTKTNFTEISSYIDRTLLISNMHRPPSAFDLCIDIKNKSTGLKEDSYRTFFCVRTSSSITSRRCQSK